MKITPTMKTKSSVILFLLPLLLGALRADVQLSGIAIVNPVDAEGHLLANQQLALVVVDRSNDGFAVNRSLALRIGDKLTDHVGDSDDVVVAANESAVLEQGVLHTIPGTASFYLEDGVNTGDRFGILFFDNLPSGSTTVTGETRYTFVSHESWVVPGDSSSFLFHRSPGPARLKQFTGLQTGFEVQQGIIPITYAEWIASHFGSGHPEAGPTDDPDGDSFVNRLEFALGMNPIIAGDKNTPVVTLERDPDGPYLMAEIRRPLTHKHIPVVAEVSTDLKEWQSGDGQVREMSRTESGEEEIIIFRSTVTEASQLFLRLATDQ